MALGYLISPALQVEDTNGKPLVGGHITVYKHGTTIPYITHKDFDGDVNPAEVILDAKGMCVLLADDAYMYDVYCTDRNRVEQWSRKNVSVGGGSGGSGSVTDITSDDGSITVIRTGDSFDLSVSEVEPSAIIVQSETRTADGPFIFTDEPINVTGADIALVGSRITCKRRWYHYDATVMIDWQGVAVNRTTEITISAPDCYERVEFDLSFPHTEWLTISADFEVQSNGGTIPFAISGMADNGMYSRLTNVSVHTLVGRTGATSDIYTDNTITGDGSLLDPLSIQDTVDSLQDAIDEKQDKLTAGANITIDANNVISATGGGSNYTAGDGIDITNDVISTDIAVQNAQKTGVDLDFGSTINTVSSITTDGSTVRTAGFNFTLPTIKAGTGVEFSKSGTETTISIDSEVGDVVETVEKLKKDLDTQITTNFDMPNISQVYDFADGSNWITHNGACMLYQSFTIPINHELRTTADDENTPTLLGLYAQQNFAHKIMLALYEYTYAAEGEEAGSSTYVGDTGPVTVLKGMNEFPLKNRNPSITELRSDKVYYASLYLPSTAFVNGLYLAGCPGYGNASIPAEPRLSCATENIIWNGEELDLDDPTTSLNHYQIIQIPGQEPYYQYYIGPWVGGYNERWSSPRFYMQIRNGEFNVPVVPTTPFNTLGDSKLPRGGILASNLPNFSASTANSAFRDVTPMTNVTITSFEWIDSMATAGGWEAGNCVFSSDYATNLSGNSNTVTDLGSQYTIDGRTAYAHRITFTTPITLTAGTTYRFLCTSFASASDWIWSWTDPTDVFDATNNGRYVDWSQNVSRYSHIAGQYNKLYDDQNNHYVI